MFEMNSSDFSRELLLLLEGLEEEGKPLTFDVEPMLNKEHCVVYTLLNGMELHVKLSNFFWFELAAVKTVNGELIKTDTLDAEVRNYVPLNSQTLINVYSIGFHQPTYISEAFWYETKTLTRRMARDKDYANKQMCSRQNRLYNSGFLDISSDYDLAKKRGLRLLQFFSEDLRKSMGLEQRKREDLRFSPTEDTSLIEEFEMLEIRDHFLRLENQISDEAFTAKMKARENRDPNIQPTDLEAAQEIGSCIINMSRPGFSFYKNEGGSYKPKQLIALGEKLTEIYDSLYEVMRVPVDDYHFRLHEIKQEHQLDTYNMACLSWIASAMKPERVKLKKLIDTIIYTPNKYSPGMLIFVLLDLDDNVHLVKLEDEYVDKLSANSFLKLYEDHERYFKTMEKMFHHDRDYVPYDPTPVKVKSPWGDSERMHTPERPLFNMSNLEQRKMFTYLATVPVSEFPKAVFNKYNFSQNDKQIFWAIHSLVEDDKLKIGDILRINRVARLQVSSGSSALFIAITDRKGKVRVFDDRMFSENKVSRRELKDYIKFTYIRSLELFSVLWTIASRKHNPAVIDHE